MYVTYDYKCPHCIVTVTRLIKKEHKDKQRCGDCKWPMKRQLSAPRTTFLFADTRLKT